MKGFLGRNRPAFRSPEKVAQDIRDIQNYLKAPTFVVGDLRQGGKSYPERFFRACRELGVDNPVILELFTPAPEDFFRMASSSLPSYSIEFSPDSHDEMVRRALGRNFDTTSMERSIQSALRHHARRFDLFFMIGLPEQTRESALASADYARRLYDLVDEDRRLFVYTSPLAPFLDPGSIAYENAERLGYIVKARTLEEHRSRLLNPSWKYVLSYETRWMTRDEIAETAYDAADVLNKARFDCHQISKAELEANLCRTRSAREMMRRIDEIMTVQDLDERQKRLVGLKAESEALMDSTICKKGDLEWDSKSVVRSAPRAFIGLMKGRRSK
jgi:radical SAM superfamily enzyme YgiQ (UPF0313 family)